MFDDFTPQSVADGARQFGKRLLDLGQDSTEFKVYQMVAAAIKTTREMGPMFEVDPTTLTVAFALKITEEILKVTGAQPQESKSIN